MCSADVSGAASRMLIVCAYAVAVGAIAHVLVVACSAYAVHMQGSYGLLLYSGAYDYSGMHICMGKVHRIQCAGFRWVAGAVHVGVQGELVMLQAYVEL